jgi:hypothetical protein
MYKKSSKIFNVKNGIIEESKGRWFFCFYILARVIW